MKDLARIYVKAGNGGTGSAHFRHERFAPKGGPDGGDGGNGGDVILLADENISSLVEFNFQKIFEAKNGEQGYGKKMHGKDRDALYIHVPMGTVVWEVPEGLEGANLRDRETFNELQKKRKLMADMDSHNKEFIVAYGGMGGRGNWHFRSATNQTPKEFEPGTPGEGRTVLLELKVVADIGIVGLPNVGKSSLLKALTRANPKIAGYPFTTLEPNLGVMQISGKYLTLVDVPGVVEEAYEGRGIGPWFLRHLERTGTLIHVLAPNCSDTVTQCQSDTEQLMRDYKIVRKELEKYGQGLAEKPELVVVNKRELVDSSQQSKINKLFEKEMGKKLLWISAISVDSRGIEPLTSSMP